jgi:hypothetical protein
MVVGTGCPVLGLRCWSDLGRRCAAAVAAGLLDTLQPLDEEFPLIPDLLVDLARYPMPHLLDWPYNPQIKQPQRSTLRLLLNLS